MRRWAIEDQLDNSAESWHDGDITPTNEEDNMFGDTDLDLYGDNATLEDYVPEGPSDADIWDLEAQLDLEDLDLDDLYNDDYEDEYGYPSAYEDE